MSSYFEKYLSDRYGTNDLFQNADAEIAELKAYIAQLEPVGDRLAMALTDAQCGFVCEYRFAWDELLEKSDG